MAEENKINEEELKNCQDAAAQSEEAQTEAQPAEEAPATDEQPAEPTEAEKLAEAEEQIAKLKDQVLRQMAEFDNFRKRTIKEKSELILNGGQKVVESLLPVLDDLDRALANMKTADDVATLREGVELIACKLMKTLAGHGLTKMETADAEFDTDFHEAIALVPTPDEKQKNHIIDCVQPGYLLNGKVIRHAKVAVGQ